MHGTEGHVLGTKGVLGLSSPRPLLLHESERPPNKFSADVFETKPQKGPQSQHEHPAKTSARNVSRETFLATSEFDGGPTLNHAHLTPMRFETNSPAPCAESRKQRLGFLHSAFLSLPSENPAEDAETACGAEAAFAQRPRHAFQPLRPVRLSYVKSELDQASAQLGK